MKLTLRTISILVLLISCVNLALVKRGVDVDAFRKTWAPKFENIKAIAEKMEQLKLPTDTDFHAGLTAELMFRYGEVEKAKQIYDCVKTKVVADPVFTNEVKALLEAIKNNLSDFKTWKNELKKMTGPRKAILTSFGMLAKTYKEKYYSQIESCKPTRRRKFRFSQIQRKIKTQCCSKLAWQIIGCLTFVTCGVASLVLIDYNVAGTWQNGFGLGLGIADMVGVAIPILIKLIQKVQAQANQSVPPEQNPVNTQLLPVQNLVQPVQNLENTQLLPEQNPVNTQQPGQNLVNTQPGHNQVDIERP